MRCPKCKFGKLEEIYSEITTTKRIYINIMYSCNICGQEYEYEIEANEEDLEAI